MPLSVRYVGAEIDDVFVLGYGLHLADLYRNVPYIVEADRDVVLAGPGGVRRRPLRAGAAPSAAVHRHSA